MRNRIFLEQVSRRISCFRGLTLLFDQMIELGEVGFS